MNRPKEFFPVRFITLSHLHFVAVQFSTLNVEKMRPSCQNPAFYGKLHYLNPLSFEVCLFNTKPVQSKTE